MPIATQGRILRVLTDQSFTRVGGQRVVKVDVRVVSATARDLTEEITEGRFREDLYYRLNAVPVAIPPLADRRQGIPSLVDHFLEQHPAGRRVPTHEIAPCALVASQRFDYLRTVRRPRNNVSPTVNAPPSPPLQR